MSHPILVTGAAGGQGSTGRRVASLLLEQDIPVRALVHKLDSRSDELRKQGAELPLQAQQNQQNGLGKRQRFHITSHDMSCNVLLSLSDAQAKRKDEL